MRGEKISEKSIFGSFFLEEPFIDRFKENDEKGVDVIIPLMNTNEFWGKNIYSFYREIPINRLLIGDNGCINEAIETVKKFPRVKIFDQKKYNTQGYSLKELISNVETKWFIYLHADVFIPQGWYEEMIKYQDKYDWYDCKRNFLYMFYVTDDEDQISRPWAGSSMGRKTAFDNIINEIEDDYIRRYEDYFFQQKIEEYGFRYGKVTSPYHIHEIMDKQSKVEKETKLRIEVKWKKRGDWLLKMVDEQFRTTIKYLSPEIDVNVKIAIANMRYLLANSSIKYKDLITWVKKTNPKWIKYISRRKVLREKIKFTIKHLLGTLLKFIAKLQSLSENPTLY